MSESRSARRQGQDWSLTSFSLLRQRHEGHEEGERALGSVVRRVDPKPIILKSDRRVDIVRLLVTQERTFKTLISPFAE